MRRGQFLCRQHWEHPKSQNSCFRYHVENKIFRVCINMSGRIVHTPGCYRCVAPLEKQYFSYLNSWQPLTRKNVLAWNWQSTPCISDGVNTVWYNPKCYIPWKLKISKCRMCEQGLHKQCMNLQFPNLNLPILVLIDLSKANLFADNKYIPVILPGNRENHQKDIF